MKNVTVEPTYLPKVTLTVDDYGLMTAVLEAQGLEPTRASSPEEQTAGIESLSPLTVSARVRDGDRSKAHRALIDASCRGMAAAATSTTGATGGAAGLMMLNLRTSMAIRKALRLAGEDI